MRITDALYGEHGSLYMLMEAIEARLAESDLATLQSSAALFETAILAHAHFENDPFFTALDRVMPGGGPVAAMRADPAGHLRGRVPPSRLSPLSCRAVRTAKCRGRSMLRKDLRPFL